jgi:hypothetical protein
MSRTATVALVVLALGQACKESPPAPAEPKPQPAAPVEGPGPKEPPPAEPLREGPDLSEPETVVDGIPTEMDYEEEAAQKITPDNLEAELDRLEREISSE